jgi:MoxR-like ATPase
MTQSAMGGFDPAQFKLVGARVEEVLGKFSTRVIGQNHLAKRLMMALVADGHILLEGLPGLAKTTAVKTIASLTGLRFSRIQFTPDLLPSDVIGTQIYDPRTASFSTKKGPIFANLVLADEINRAPAKVQSALLEAMGEHQVTIGGETFTMTEPFLVMATQNPIEQEGTYSLPEAQVDRFMFKVKVAYGSMSDEEAMLKAANSGDWNKELQPVFSRSEILEMRQLASAVKCADKIREYIVRLVFATREPERFDLKDIKSWVELGASPRASLCLERAARVNALMLGRDFVLPQDVKDVALDILRHRIALTYAAEADGVTQDQVVEKILGRVPIS